ncbi:MAG: putative permease [Labilithrix sp.]|nr:putative permease [Labilithrix sp.]
MSAAEVEDGAAKAPFPKTFYFANAMELCERLAHYGFYIGLSLFLSNVVKMGDVEVGVILGNWRLVASLAPIPCGAIADRITFKRSLILAFSLYAIAYVALMSFPVRAVVVPALFLAAIAGGFMKPVILGTVVRTSPPGRQEEGFGVFYRMINSGSVIGKTLAYGVRRVVAVRFVAGTSVIASLIALAIAIFGYEEPKDDAPPAPPLKETLKGYGMALSDLRFAAFLLVFAGFWFMAEQFYMTFPKYVTRHIDEKAPLEIITLVNPACIALFQGRVTRIIKRFDPMRTMAFGVVIGSLSMLVMGAVPSLIGAVLSGALFALAEMTFSPRFYDQIASFAPKGKAGMYMGLAFVPAAIGALVGGLVSGPMIARYMPAHGPRNPLAIWSIYAGLGLTCAVLMLVYSLATRRPRGEAAGS